MTEYYCDADLTTGNNDGSSQANAWQNLQAAIDGLNGTQPTAGDKILCKGTDSISAAIDVDGNAGTAASRLELVGVNGSWAEDGTRFVIDAGDAAINVLAFVGASDYLTIRNFELRDTTGSGNGINIGGYTALEGLILSNVYIHDMGGAGISSGSSGAYSVCAVGCRFEDNGGSGVEMPGVLEAYFCTFKGNSAHGASFIGGKPASAPPHVFYGCEIHGNGDDGIAHSTFDGTLAVIASVVDGNTNAGLDIDTGGVTICGARITENGTGVDFGSLSSALMFSYMPDATEDRDNTTKTAGNYEVIHDKSGADSNELSGTDTDAGYNAPATDDFNLVSGATLKDVEIDLQA